MKKVINIVIFVLVATGLFFKVEHWPGANVILILSYAGLLMMAVYAFLDNKELGTNDMVNYTMTAFLILILTSILFNIMHWPGKHELAEFGYLFSIGIPLGLLLSTKDIKISKQYMAVFLMAFMMILTLMRSNPDFAMNNEKAPSEATAIDTTASTH